MTNFQNDPLLITTLFIARVVSILLTIGAILAFIATGFIAFDTIQGSGILAEENPSMDPEALQNRLVLLLPLAGIGFALAAAFMRRLAQIIASVSKGDPFDATNASHLAKMAWLALAFQLIAIPVRIVRNQVGALTNGISSDDMAISISGLVFVLTLFVLARVFAYGAQMRDDLEGTV